MAQDTIDTGGVIRIAAVSGTLLIVGIIAVYFVFGAWGLIGEPADSVWPGIDSLARVLLPLVLGSYAYVFHRDWLREKFEQLLGIPKPQKKPEASTEEKTDEEKALDKEREDRIQSIRRVFIGVGIVVGLILGLLLAYFAAGADYEDYTAPATVERILDTEVTQIVTGLDGLPDNPTAEAMEIRIRESLSTISLVTTDGEGESVLDTEIAAIVERLAGLPEPSRSEMIKERLSAILDEWVHPYTAARAATDCDCDADGTVAGWLPSWNPRNWGPLTAGLCLTILVLGARSFRNLLRPEKQESKAPELEKPVLSFYFGVVLGILLRVVIV